jgi:phosphoribosylanthranilate isomerase
VTYVKICGLTTLADVRLAVEQDAWACGFVLTRSPRHVSPLRAQELARAARTSLTVAVVTTESPTWIAAALAAADTPDVDLADYVLLDARAPGRYGGTGCPLPWADLRDQIDERTRQRLILAGGLTPDNVAEAVRILRPLAVDVSSGVESAPGCKDALRLSRFFAAVAAVEPVTPVEGAP